MKLSTAFFAIVAAMIHNNHGVFADAGELPAEGHPDSCKVRVVLTTEEEKMDSPEGVVSCMEDDSCFTSLARDFFAYLEASGEIHPNDDEHRRSLWPDPSYCHCHFGVVCYWDSNNEWQCYGDCVWHCHRRLEDEVEDEVEVEINRVERLVDDDEMCWEDIGSNSNIEVAAVVEAHTALEYPELYQAVPIQYKVQKNICASCPVVYPDDNKDDVVSAAATAATGVVGTFLAAAVVLV